MRIMPACHILGSGLQSRFDTGEIDSDCKKLHWKLRVRAVMCPVKGIWTFEPDWLLDSFEPCMMGLSASGDKAKTSPE